MPNNTTPLLPKPVVKCLSPFLIQMLPKKNFLSDFVKPKLNLHIIKSILGKISLNWCFQRNVGSNLEGAQTYKHCFIKTNSLKTLPEWNDLCRLCSKWSSCLPVRLSTNKELSLLTGGQYAQDRVGERRKFSPLIFQWQGHLMLKIKPVLSDRKRLWI